MKIIAFMELTLHKKWIFPVRILVTFTEEIRNGKLHLLYSVKTSEENHCDICFSFWVIPSQFFDYL